MQFPTIAFTLLATASALATAAPAEGSNPAQLAANLPACALPCIQDGSKAIGCTLGDFGCICTKLDAFTGAVAPCALQNCKPDDINKLQSTAGDICKAAGGAAPSPSAPSSPAGASPTPKAPATTAPASASASSASAPAPAASTSAATSAAASTSASAPASSTSASSATATPTTVPTAAGSRADGAGALLLAGAAAMVAMAL